MAIITSLQNLKNVFVSDELKKVYEFLESCLNDRYKKKDYRANKRVYVIKSNNQNTQIGNENQEDFKIQNNGEDDEIFAILQTYRLKPKGRAFFETHKKYVDIQMTVKGAECFMLGDSKDFKVKKDYDLTKDVVEYKASKRVHKILSFRSNVCIFFPEDVHAGGLGDRILKNNKVCKVVVKIPTEMIDIRLF